MRHSNSGLHRDACDAVYPHSTGVLQVAYLFVGSMKQLHTGLLQFKGKCHVTSVKNRVSTQRQPQHTRVASGYLTEMGC